MPKTKKDGLIDGFMHGIESYRRISEKLNAAIEEIQKNGGTVTNERIKEIQDDLMHEEMEIRKIKIVSDIIESAENMPLSDVSSLADNLLKQFGVNEEALNNAKNEMWDLISDFMGNAENKTAEASEQARQEKDDKLIKEIQRNRTLSIIEELQSNIQALNEEIEETLKKYIIQKDPENTGNAKLANDFMSALSEMEQAGDEPAIIYAIKHYLDTDEAGNKTPEAEKAENILNSAYEKAISEKNKPLKNTDTYLETITSPVFKYYFPIDKTVNSLEKLKIDGITRGLSEEKAGTSKEVTTYISFDFDEAAKETDLSEFTLTFSEFDKQVQEAVISLMKAGNVIITSKQIYKTLTGNEGEKITPKWKQEIDKSMRKYNSVLVTADFTDTAKLYKPLKKIEKIVKKTRLMQFETTFVETKNGSEVYAYKMLTEPILYTISDMKDQVGTLNIELLENSKTTNSLDTTELKIYLLKRINGMKHGLTTSISYDTLYRVMNRNTDKEKRTTRNNAEKLLMQFEADKVIKSFEIKTQGKKATGIKIILNPEK